MVDEKSGPSFDVRVFETFMRANNMQQRLLLLCLTAEQVMTRELLSVGQHGASLANLSTYSVVYSLLQSGCATAALSTLTYFKNTQFISLQLEHFQNQTNYYTPSISAGYII